MLTVVMPLPVPVPSLGIYSSTGLTLSMHPAKKKKTETRQFLQTRLTHKHGVWCHMGVRSLQTPQTCPNQQQSESSHPLHRKRKSNCAQALPILSGSAGPFPSRLLLLILVQSVMACPTWHTLPFSDSLPMVMLLLMLVGIVFLFIIVSQVFLAVIGGGLTSRLRGVLGVAAAGGEAGGGSGCARNAVVQLLQLFLGKLKVGQLRAHIKAGQGVGVRVGG